MSFKYAIVLTGGIGSGKSTIASFLKLYGYEVVCADSIAHTILDQSTKEVVEIFGKEILENNRINRKRLGEIVFNDKKKKEILEKILHPKIKEEILKQAKALETKKIPYFLDIPLFYETKNYPFKEVLLVFVPREIQIQRIQKRDHLELQAIQARISSQIPLEEKKQLASYVIDNSGDLENLQKEVEKYLQDYLPKVLEEN
ncbi:dephospho-CoA kinase [Helicobacter canadensis]|uniref:Dephospho-CoA kinase n=1 Tax=Helicobacter canadensis MIT 98-5491 TaxID=537970 RepID=C5ZVF6_9HELI|nr:dephospho-CoA kinase [Helicobacter canadensis]EES89080.1 dephospho-CoA kinase [Helicobacter canadensis MIT 98-5491]EFR47857.1 dephospho-CoA kinase [Helicobacter canadensis MIT 98-5491]STO99110.1 dephospho-CoA kinase [Helicobacter canadensis]